jgi:hypothetical protein
VTFPSPEWAGALVAALNRQPGLRAALAGMPPVLAAVVEADPPAVLADVAVWGRHAGGRVAEWRVLEDPDEILEIEPAYVVRAPFRVWKALLRGEDPLQAARTGRVRIQGDLEALVRRLRFRYVVDAALAEVPTAFADEAGGRR